MRKKLLSGNALKLIAIGAMTLDYLVWTVAPGYDRIWWVLLCHALGRITAPIMWFFIAEGFHHTRSVRRYAVRLFVFALLSHFPYTFCFGLDSVPLRSGIFNQTGVMWALAWGLILLWICKAPHVPQWGKFVAIFGACILAFPADWSCVASMAVLFMGMERGDLRKQMLWMLLWSAVYGAVYVVFLDWVYGLLQLATCLSIPLIACYDGTRGKQKWVGKLFYLYYPAHLVTFGLLRLVLS